MDSLVIYPLKHIIPKEKNGNGFHFPYKPNFTIFISENEVTLIWFSLLIGKIMLIFQGIESIFSWLKADWYEWFVWGRTSGFQQNHWGVCTRLLLGNSLMFCLPILVLSGSGKEGLPEGTLSPPASIIQGGGTLWSFAALNDWFSLSQKGEGFFFNEAQH